MTTSKQFGCMVPVKKYRVSGIARKTWFCDCPDCCKEMHYTDLAVDEECYATSKKVLEGYVRSYHDARDATVVGLIIEEVKENFPDHKNISSDGGEV